MKVTGASIALLLVCTFATSAHARQSSQIQQTLRIRNNGASSSSRAPISAKAGLQKSLSDLRGGAAPASVSQFRGGAAAPQKGAKMVPLMTSVAIALIVWFLPCPSSLAAMPDGKQAWHLLAIFLATIYSIVTTPLPLGAVALMGLAAAMTTQTMKFADAFSAMGTEIPWLIAMAFFFARGFIKTGLGNRIAYMIVSQFGSTTLGLCYSLVLTEAALSPAIPSTAARAGGIFFPLTKALCEASGSTPEKGTERDLGAFLMTTCFQTSCISSAMFLTSMAANPLCAELAFKIIGKQMSWGQWALAGIVPGMTSLILIPLLIYIIYPPNVKSSPEAPKLARAQLIAKGPMTVDEKIMGLALLGTVILWIVGKSIGIGSVNAAVLGLSVLLITGVLKWKECLAEGVAWDTLTWFGALIAMASKLNKLGLIKWLGDSVTDLVGGFGLSWPYSFGILSMLYFYSHYLFASGAAHISAMYTAFLTVAVSLGTPKLFAAYALAFLSNLMGGITHYGIGSAPPFFGAGYVPIGTWWTLGGIVSVANIVIWMGLGSIWWKAIGLFEE